MATKIIFLRLKYPIFRVRRPKNFEWRLFFFFFYIDLGDKNQFASPNVIFVYNLATKICFLSPKVICVYNLATKNMCFSSKDIIVICVYNLIIYKETIYNYSLHALELLTLKYSVHVIC
jgi:hypothetical protein